jgi:hypothetical protein
MPEPTPPCAACVAHQNAPYGADPHPGLVEGDKQILIVDDERIEWLSYKCSDCGTKWLCEVELGDLGAWMQDPDR